MGGCHSVSPGLAGRGRRRKGERRMDGGRQGRRKEGRGQWPNRRRHCGWGLEATAKLRGRAKGFLLRDSAWVFLLTDVCERNIMLVKQTCRCAGESRWETSDGQGCWQLSVHMGTGWRRRACACTHTGLTRHLTSDHLCSDPLQTAGRDWRLVQPPQLQNRAHSAGQQLFLFVVFLVCFLLFHQSTAWSLQTSVGQMCLH